MKYYINDRLVRTSDRIYTHAVMFDDEVRSCCGNLQLATKELNRRLSALDVSSSDCRKAIKAIDEGKTYYMATFDRRPYKEKIRYTREEYMQFIANSEDLKTRWHICELESR